MADWIDTTYIDTFLSTEVRTELLNDETGTPAITTIIQAAQSRVEAALRHAGYTPPATANPDLQLATLGQFISLIYSRPSKSLPVPEGLTSYVEMEQQIRNGELQPKGLTPDQLGSHGGVEFTESDPDVDGSAKQFSTRDDLAGF